MSEWIWKLISGLLAGLGVAFLILAGTAWDGPDTVAALFGGSGLGALCIFAAAIAWDRTLL